MAFLDLGNFGWEVDDTDPVDIQQEKVEKILLITERVLESLKEVVSIYAKFGDAEAFATFQDRVNEAMEQASFESFFNDDNYENTGQ